MDYHAISQDEREQQRLIVQRRLLSPYETPVIDKVFRGRTGLRILDIGSGLGRKAVECFSNRGISKLIGLEFQEEMVAQANAIYGSSQFTYHICNVESEEFDSHIAHIMQQEGVEGFDLIYLSFVLMYIRDIHRLFRKLKPLLAPGGCIMVIEPDDSICHLSPDPQGLLKSFLEILGAYPMAGDRSCGSRVYDALTASGFSRVTMENEWVCAKPGQQEKKADMYETYLSYLSEDLALLVQEEPKNPQYAAWKGWLDTHSDALYQAVMFQDAEIAMGNRILLAQ